MRGQASLEYVAALALLVLLLAGAGAAVAAPDLPGTVVHHVRVALCIVGGDICRASDAEQRGLEPCVVAGEDHERENGFSLLTFHTSAGQTWSVQRLSDGRIRLSGGRGGGLDLTTGLGIDIGQASIGGSASGGLGFRSGRTWELSGEAELARLLRRVRGYDLSDPSHAVAAGFPEPVETYLEGGSRGSASLGVLALKGFPGGQADVRETLGRRTGSDGTTYYLDLGGDTGGLLTDLVPEADLHGHVVAEYRASSPPVITLRGGGRGHDDTETETIMRLALSDPGDAAAARRVAFLSLHDPVLAVRDMVSRIRDHGTVERLTYQTKTDDDSWRYGLAAGLKLGAEGAHSVTRRELVDAQLLNNLPSPARRADCLGVD